MSKPKTPPRSNTTSSAATTSSSSSGGGVSLGGYNVSAFRQSPVSSKASVTPSSGASTPRERSPVASARSTSRTSPPAVAVAEPDAFAWQLPSGLAFPAPQPAPNAVYAPLSGQRPLDVPRASYASRQPFTNKPVGFDTRYSSGTSMITPYSVGNTARPTNMNIAPSLPNPQQPPMPVASSNRTTPSKLTRQVAATAMFQPQQSGNVRISAVSRLTSAASTRTAASGAPSGMSSRPNTTTATVSYAPRSTGGDSGRNNMPQALSDMMRSNTPPQMGIVTAPTVSIVSAPPSRSGTPNPGSRLGTPQSSSRQGSPRLAARPLTVPETSGHTARRGSGSSERDWRSPSRPVSTSSSGATTPKHGTVLPGQQLEGEHPSRQPVGPPLNWREQNFQRRSLSQTSFPVALAQRNLH